MELILCFLAIMEDACKTLPQPKIAPKTEAANSTASFKTLGLQTAESIEDCQRAISTL